MYRTWGTHLPGTEVCPVTLPGRETLLSQTPVSDSATLVQLIATQLVPFFDRPFAFFGHSMGSWIAFELARYLKRQGAPQPVHLFASARRAPQVPQRESSIHDISDAELIAELQDRYQGIPDVVMNEPELLAMLMPALRADLTLLETYDYRSASPFDFPITALGGLDDAMVPSSDLAAWAIHTTAAFELEQYPGAHFYLQELSAAPLLERLDRCLSAHAAA